jgi:hypothetical protein
MLIFTPEDHSAKNVTVYGVDDGRLDGNSYFKIYFYLVTSEDPRFWSSYSYTHQSFSVENRKSSYYTVALSFRTYFVSAGVFEEMFLSLEMVDSSCVVNEDGGTCDVRIGYCNSTIASSCTSPNVSSLGNVDSVVIFLNFSDSTIISSDLSFEYTSSLSVLEGDNGFTITVSSDAILDDPRTLFTFSVTGVDDFKLNGPTSTQLNIDAYVKRTSYFNDRSPSEGYLPREFFLYSELTLENAASE